MKKNGGAPTLAGASMGQYFHACGFFRDRDEAYRVLVPFIKEGMERGEKGLHITNPGLRADHMQRLQTSGVDTDDAEQSGDLEVLTWDEAYLKGGRFDAEGMLGILEDAIRADVSAGYPSTRIIGDMGWALEKKPGVEQVMQYEARVNYVLAKHRKPAVCAYDVTKIDATTMLNLLRTHPLVVMGDTLTENPFFMAPDRFLAQMEAH